MLKRTFLATAYTLLYIYAHAQNILSYTNFSEAEVWADSIIATLTPEERLGQLIIPIVANDDNAQQRALIKSNIEKYHIGGLLFSKGTTSSQEALTKYAQETSKVPLMITTDSEWGLAMRLTDAVRFPKNMALGCINHTKVNGSTLRDSLMYDYGYEVGTECRAMGISVNFAPVLDINNNPNNPVIGNRSFGDNIIDVASAALSYSSGVEDAGVLAVGKHFPGHGDTDKDSHKTLPLLKHDKQRMETFEMRTFQEFAKAGFGGMMVAHLEIPSLEPTTSMPSSASQNIITGYLRQKFNFNGLVFTDGLAMEGARKFPGFCVKALNAGIDILLDPITLSTQWKALTDAVASGELSQDVIDNKCKRVLIFKYALQSGIMPDRDKINTWKANELSRLLYQESIVLLKHEKDFANDTVINIVNGKKETVETVRRQVRATKKPVTLVFYTTPFNMAYYKDAINAASSVILAHEDYVFAHEAVDNVLIGREKVRGQLCVEIPGLFKNGEGIILDKTPRMRTAEFANLADIDSIVTEGLREGAFPGCQVLVAKDGKIIYNKAFGWHDDKKTKKVTLESVYDLASVSKAAATVPALMLAIDECGISVNDKLSKYLEEMKDTDKKNLTIRQALFHETGMRDGYPFYGMTIDSASVNGRLYSARKDATFSIQQDRNTWFNKNLKWNSDWISAKKSKEYPLQIAEGMYIRKEFRQEILNKIVDLPLRNIGRYRYSCLNFVVLRNIIERTTKKPLDVYLGEKLFKPLGLKSTFYNPHEQKNFDMSNIVPTENDEAIRKQLLTGFVHDEIAAWSGGVEGNAGLFSNTTDLVKILQLLLDNGAYNGKQIIKEETCKMFCTTKSAHSRRGLGFDKPEMSNPDKSPCAVEANSNVFGHTGYTGTCFWVDPENKMIYIFLCNRVNPTRLNGKLSAGNYRTRIQSVLYNELVR